MSRKHTDEEKLKLAKEIHKDDNYEYLGFDEKKKIIFICHNKNENGTEHGERHQLYSHHVDSKNPAKCTQCGTERVHKKQRNTREEIINKFRDRHGTRWEPYIGPYINNHTSMKATCKIHGVFDIKPLKHMSRGDDCYKCSMKEAGVNKSQKAADTFFTKLVIKNPYFEDLDFGEFVYDKAKTKQWISCGKCGHRWKTCADSLLDGHGCPNCKKSLGETLIEQWAIDNGYIEGEDYNTQKRFDDCRGKRYPLPFDFYFIKLNKNVEYDDLQHEKPIKYFGGEVEFNNRKTRDKTKTDYCTGLNEKPTLLRISWRDRCRISEILDKEIGKRKHPKSIGCFNTRERIGN